MKRVWFFGRGKKKSAGGIPKERRDAIEAYLRERYLAPETPPDRSLCCSEMRAEAPEEKRTSSAARIFPKNAKGSFEAAPLGQAKPDTLDDALRRIDESFSEMLLRKIDEKGMTDAECYKKARVDRKLFSKIRGDRLYRPSKSTVLSFAIALELSLDETKEMLMKAGFALSRSSKADIIVEYFITHRNFDLYDINEALFAFDQALLGV